MGGRRPRGRGRDRGAVAARGRVLTREADPPGTPAEPAGNPDLPTFVLIGAMKAGTSSLAHYLAGHPDVFVTDPKEPDFFHPGRNWRLGLAWYRGLFAGAAGATARGEASTAYTAAPHVSGVPQRMASVVPWARLVYLVRHPVERIRSMYVHRLDRGMERAPIDEAVREDPRYVDLSRYAAQLERYLEWFPRERILVVSSERLRDDRAATVDEVLGFLGVRGGVGPEVLDRELKRREERRRARPGLGFLDPVRVALRRSGWTGRIPAPLRRGLIGVRRAASRPVPPDASRLSADTEQWLWDRLEPDVEALARLVPEGFPLWRRG